MDILYLMEREMHRRGMSQRSVDAYCENVRYFLNYCKKDPKKIKDFIDIVTYISGAKVKEHV